MTTTKELITFALKSLIQVMEDSYILMQKPLTELTLQDLLPHLRKIVSEEVKKAVVQGMPLALAGTENEIEEEISLHPEKYVIGLDGLAELLHVCPKTAFNYSKSGKYDPAIERIGNKIFVNKKIALLIAKGMYVPSE